MEAGNKSLVAVRTNTPKGLTKKMRCLIWRFYNHT